jgi:hypothetical protein
LPCCNNSDKGSLEFWKNKSENGKICKSGKNVLKNNGTYFSLDKRFFVLQFTVLFVPLVKGNVQQLFLELGSDNYFPLTSVK